jgi:hypothetical protein
MNSGASAAATRHIGVFASSVQAGHRLMQIKRLERKVP